MIDLRRSQPAPASRALVILGLALALLSVAAPVAAAPKDVEAQDLAKKAIYTDYLGTKFADAEKKLKQALLLCEPEAACSAPVRARIRCDLGVVYVGGMNRVDDGKEQFAEALRQDPSVAPDKDLVSPEIEAAFAEVKRAPSGEKKPTPPKPQPPAPPSSPAGGGDLVHTPPAEQATMTPLPIYAELPPGVGATRVQLSYKPFGATEWKSLEMKAVDKGFGVEVPCAEIGSAPGDFAYFIQAFDATNNLVSWSGARGAPDKVPVRVAINGDAPHLPGQPPPAKCPEVGDCPPEFPGCHDKDKPAPVCEPGATDCVPAEAPAKKNWLSIAFQQDFLALPGSSTTCAGSNGYDCFAGSSYYNGIPYVGSGDVVQGGLAAATSRVLLGYDRALGNFTLGARLGVAFRGGPQTPGFNPFLPVHAEGRAAYWFGHDPFARTGLRPYLVVAGGVAQVDASVQVKLYKTADDYAANNVDHYDAWRKTGLGFVGGGAGLGLGVAPRHVIFVEAKFVELLGLPGSSLNFQLGYALGL
jgi:hypothetical protein